MQTNTVEPQQHQACTSSIRTAVCSQNVYGPMLAIISGPESPTTGMFTRTLEAPTPAQLIQISNAPRSYLFSQTREYATTEDGSTEAPAYLSKSGAIAETPQAPEPQLNKDASPTGEGLAALDSLLDSNPNTSIEMTRGVNTRSCVSTGEAVDITI